MIKKEIFLNALLVLFAIIVTLVLCNFALQLFAKNKNGTRLTAEKLLIADPVFQAYTAMEKDLSLPLYTPKQGSDCVLVIRKPSGMHYSPYFGWNTQQLDQNCARQHFAQDGTKVIYFGGSAMENFEAPNYLTKIDTYISNLLPEVVSLNLAESGGRSTNNLVRIMIEAFNLPADYWVFLDGYNEFNSIKYGGNYAEDFYWTAAVKDRIHKPVQAIIDKIITKSALLEKLFYATGMINKTRLHHQIADSDIIAAADYYVLNQQKIKAICEQQHIKCVFFLQPYKRSEGSMSTMVLDKGYARIIELLGDNVIDLRPQFVGHDDYFVDEVHYNKLGSEMIAMNIAMHLQTPN